MNLNHDNLSLTINLSPTVESIKVILNLGVALWVQAGAKEKVKP